MNKPIRKVQIAQGDVERLRADIEADDVDHIAELLASLLIKLSRKSTKAWQEVFRVAQLDEETEECRLSLITNEILVYPKRVLDI